MFLGTTGEPATMTQDECDEVIKFAVDYVNHRVPVIAGAGGNNTRIAIEKASAMKNLELTHCFTSHLTTTKPHKTDLSPTSLKSQIPLNFQSFYIMCQEEQALTFCPQP